MSTSSQHLGLILNDPTDGFKREDFITNWSTIDQYPGVFVCTSTTRPTWTANQAGQAIYERDSRRTLHWSGTAWHAGADLPLTYTGSIAPAVNLTPSQTVTYTMGTINVLTPATLFVSMVIEGRQNRSPSPSSSALGFNVYPLIDNANASTNVGSAAFYSQWTECSPSGAFNDYRCIPALGLKSVGVGSHQVGVKISTTSIGSNGGNFLQASFVAQLVNTADV